MQALNNRTIIFFLLLLTICAACGPNIIRGRPPFISITNLNLDDQQLTTVFSVNNQNGEPMEINGITIRVQIQDTEMTRYDENFKLTIGANSSEDVTVKNTLDALSRELLESLEKGDLISVPFELEGHVRTLADGNLKFRNKGHLYPVPGRPGQFRSATTHSNRVDGDDPFKVIENRQ